MVLYSLILQSSLWMDDKFILYKIVGKVSITQTNRFTKLHPNSE